MLDGSVVRAHRHAAGAHSGQENEALGRSCGGFSTKIHALVDALGMPLDFRVSPGQDADISHAPAMIQGACCEQLIADRGYDSDAFRAQLQQQGIQPVIAGRKNRKEPVAYDRHTYRERNAVERLLGRLKEFRRIATRYDKTAVMYRGALIMTAVILWLKF